MCVGGGGWACACVKLILFLLCLCVCVQKPNLILNVDGVIAVSFVDLLRHSGAFTA